MQYIQPFGAATGAPYVNGNPATGVSGSIPPAAAIENTQREIVNLITDAALTPDNANLHQLSQGVQSGKLNSADDTSGTANIVNLSLTPALASYNKGLVVVAKIANANTGPTTLNVNGVGATAVLRPDGTPLLPSDLSAGSMAFFVYNGTNWQLIGLYGNPRPRLTANKDYYVSSSTGSDTLNNGLSSGSPFATIGKALSVMSTYDNNGFNVTIHCATGSYAGATLPRLTGSGKVFIVGDTTTPANCVCSGPFGGVATGGAYDISGFKMATSGDGVFADLSGTVIYLSYMDFGACTGPAHIVAQRGGAIVLSSGNWKVSGACPSHLLALDGGNIAIYPQNLTLVGTPNFSTAFAFAGRCGVIASPTGTTWSSITGASTGVRYQVQSNAVIDAAGAGATVYPGNSAGVSVTGGQYL
jgi:hypothetical protein